MKSLKSYYSELTEGLVQRNGNVIKTGSLRLQFYHDHVFYTIGNGSEIDLSIYKDGGFKPPRQNEIYVKDARDHGVPQDFVTIIATWLNTSKDRQEELMPRIVQALEFLANKYSNKQATNEVCNSEVDAMKKPKITTEVDLDETEGLYNSTADRWSRRAKHHLSKNELQSAADVFEFVKGEHAVYEGKEVEVRIPVGPNGTAGVMLEGHLKMVKRDMLTKLDESMGIVSAMTPLGPLNRIMQLAGLEHSGAVTETVETEELDEDANMFDNLYKANLNKPEWKNNPDATKVATIGQILASMQELINALPQNLPNGVSTRLHTVPAIGAELIKAAQTMTKVGNEPQ